MGRCRERGCSIAVRYSVSLCCKGRRLHPFRRVHLEERMQVGQGQNLADHFRDVAQLHVAVTGSQTSKEANDGTQATAVNESDVAEVQDNLFQVAIETLNTVRRLSTSGPPTIRPLQRTTTTSPTDRELSVRGNGSPQALNLSAGRLQTPMRCQHGRGF